MFDDLFTKDDFSFEEKGEEKELELETSDDEDEEPDPCGPDCNCEDGTCTCDPDDEGEACSDCDNCDKSVWDTGYRKPPVPKKVWKPKTWKT